MFLNYLKKTQQPVLTCKYSRTEELKFVSVLGIRRKEQLWELISMQSFPLSFLALTIQSRALL